MMKKLSIYVLLVTVVCNCKAQNETSALNEKFSMRIVANKLSDPWGIIYGPDDYLWVTEAKGYKVSRISIATGKKTVLLDLNDERKFPRYDIIPDSIDGGKPWPQNGLMGMALHPQLLKGKPYVYLSYIWYFAGADSAGNGCAINFGGCYFKTKIVRYEYDQQQQKLIHAVIICDTIPGSSDHNGGRLLIAPVNGKEYLFYSIGEMGAGQFGNGARTNNAQNINVYEGKILRFNTEPDNDTGKYEKWIPNDNPFNNDKQNAVYTYGHRNPQGLAYAVINNKGILYEAEHGPFSDDEINIIERGKNYGHPLIIGFDDGNYNGLAAGVSDHETIQGTWHTSYPFIKDEKANADSIGRDNYRNPLITFYPNSHAFLQNLFTSIRDKHENGEWSSEAPSGIDVYTANAIPEWKSSLLITSLKNGKLIRLKLNDNGNGIVGDTISYFKAPVRYRDIAISPDGRKLYLSTDSSAVSSGPSKEDPKDVSKRGCIIEFTYIPGKPDAEMEKQNGESKN